MDPYGTPEFDGFLPPPDPLPPSDNGVVKWRQWKGLHTLCMECVRAGLAGERRGAPSPAAYVYTTGEQEQFLCYEHAAAVRHH